MLFNSFLGLENRIQIFVFVFLELKSNPIKLISAYLETETCKWIFKFQVSFPSKIKLEYRIHVWIFISLEVENSKIVYISLFNFVLFDVVLECSPLVASRSIVLTGRVTASLVRTIQTVLPSITFVQTAEASSTFDTTELGRLTSRSVCGCRKKKRDAIKQVL